MADTNKKGDFDIFIAQSIFPEASSIFTSRLKSLEEIKNDGCIVLDTNVLLAPYTIGRENLLEQCRNTYKPLVDAKRLIIPGQVAREFAKHRQEKLAELHQQLSRKKQIQPIQKGKYPLLSSLDTYKEIVRLGEEIDEKLKEYQKAVDKVLTHIQGWLWNDPVSLLYQEIFTEDTIVDIPIKEEEVKKDLQRRQMHDIPPGYKDSGKKDEGVGDLLIWYTILEIGKTRKKSVIFVTGEEKADWYKKSEGQPLYPRYELVDEFRRQSEGQTFQIVKFSRFLELYGANEKVVEDIKTEEKLLTALTDVNVASTSWRDSIASVLRRFLILWSVYGGDTEKLIDPFFSQMQNTFLLISNQIQDLFALNPEHISEENMLNLRNIAEKLIKLGTMQFYIDGGLSVKKFDELGDNIVKDAANLIDQINETK